MKEVCVLPYVVRIIYHDFSVKYVYPIRSRDALVLYIKRIHLDNVREVVIVPFNSNKVLEKYLEMLGLKIEEKVEENISWEIGKTRENEKNYRILDGEIKNDTGSYD